MIYSCPNCDSDNLCLYVSKGYDLYSNYVVNYFLECKDCGTSIKSRNLKKLIEIWNNAK